MTKTSEELTEDWKAGKLENGWYFCKLKNGLIHHFEFYDNDFTDLTCHIPPVAEVLAPCDYDEYKAMQDQIADASKTIEELEDEIAELKEENKQLEEDTGYGWHTAGIESDKNDKLRDLLRECKSFLEYAHPIEDISVFEGIEELLTRINAALGESEEQ